MRSWFIQFAKNILAIFLGTTDNYYIDLDICKKKNIQVLTLPEYIDNSVTEYLIKTMITFAKKIPITLSGKKVGIIGLTSVGKKIADICDSIGMKVYYWDKIIRQTNYDYIELNKIFEICDIIYFCFEEKYESKEIIPDELLKKIDDDTIFISFKENKMKDKVNKPNVIEIDKYSCYTNEDNILKIKKWYENIIDYLQESYTVSIEEHNNKNNLHIFDIYYKWHKCIFSKLIHYYN